MNRIIGYTISLIEEILFIGFISALILFVMTDINISEAFLVISEPACFTDYFLVYAVVSLIGYPIILFVSCVVQKADLVYDGQFKHSNISKILIFDIYNDVIFPVYLLTRTYPFIKKMLYLFFIWIIPVTYSALNLFILLN